MYKNSTLFKKGIKMSKVLHFDTITLQFLSLSHKPSFLNAQKLYYNHFYGENIFSYSY